MTLIYVPTQTATVDEVVGYYSSADTSSCRPPVQAFLNRISANRKGGPAPGYVNRFDTSNDTYIDQWDMVFCCAHGNRWRFAFSNGTVNLNSSYFGGGSHKGWGNVDLEWVILYSCLVVASPLETSSWYQVWVDESRDVFDRLHILNGFRTSAYVWCAPNVADDYARRLNNGGYILGSWFDAIYAEGDFSGGMDRGCSVFYEQCRYDRVNSFSSDPAETQESNFKCSYIR
jgi:hypothetical protein